MPDEKTIYASDAERYEALIAREDYRHNIEVALEQIIKVDGLDVLDLGAGTGRLAGMFAARPATLRLFDTSHPMLALARDKLRRLAPRSGSVAVAHHRFLPLPASSADVVLSGWSVSYLAAWSPERWRLELDAWLDEMRRVLRPRGMVILFESLGTGHETPLPLLHLENFYAWLDEMAFEKTWIRTDYRFDSVAQASSLSGFFFGEEIAARIQRDALTILPECTGVWWRRVDGA